MLDKQENVWEDQHPNSKEKSNIPHPNYLNLLLPLPCAAAAAAVVI